MRRHNAFLMIFPVSFLIVSFLSGCTAVHKEVHSTKTTDIVLEAEPETIPACENPQTICFADDFNRDLALQKPKRVAALIGSFADLWITASGKETLIAAAHDAWTSFDLDLDEDIVDLGEIKNPSLESLVACKPDLVLASAKNDSHKKLLTALEEASIPVAYFDVSSFSDYLHVLEIFTRLTGDDQAYQTYGQNLEKQITALKEAAKSHQPQNILYLRAAGSSVKAKNSKGTVLGEMLEELNTNNIADSNGMLEDLSMEAILEANPDKIFLVVQGSDPKPAKKLLEETFLSHPAWQSLDAVKNDQVYWMDSSLYNLKPNARWAKACKKLYAILYGALPEGVEE